MSENYRILNAIATVEQGVVVRKVVFPSINAAKRANRATKHPEWAGAKSLPHARDYVLERASA